MTARSLLFLPLILSISGAAQNMVQPSSFAFSDGVLPTLSFTFEGTDVRSVESYWKDELKKMSASVSSKKELIAAAALIPQVSTDTVRILMKAEQHKGSPLTVAHVAILTTAGALSPNSEPKTYDAGVAFVQRHSTLIRHQLATRELTLAVRGLDKLKGELRELQRAKERAEAGIEKSNQKAAEAVQDRERYRVEAEANGPRITELRSDVTLTTDEAMAKELADLEKQRDKALDKQRKAENDERNMTKKADDLTWDIKKNVEDQARKSEAIAQQETLVESLREKLKTIR